MSEAVRDSLSKANLYIIRRWLYRTADAAFRGVEADVGRFNYSYIRSRYNPPKFSTSSVVNHAGSLVGKLRVYMRL